jgi:hypothetical protein
MATLGEQGEQERGAAARLLRALVSTARVVAAARPNPVLCNRPCRPREIGPKTAFFGPIPAEMGRNGPEMRASSRASTAGKTLQISQTQGQRAPIAPRRSPVRVRLAPSEVPGSRAHRDRRHRPRGTPGCAGQLLVNFRVGAKLRRGSGDPRQGGLRWDRPAPAAFGSSAASIASRTASTRSAGATRAGCASARSASTSRRRGVSGWR